MKLALALALTAVTVGAGFAFGTPGPTAVYRDHGLTFRYPAAWSLRQWVPNAGELRFAVWLSNARLRAPCVRTGASTTCSSPLRRLPRDTVLVTWTLSRPPGSMGRASPLSVRRPGGCRSNGADETISKGFAGSYFMEACLREPDLGAKERQVLAMLASTRLLGS